MQNNEMVFNGATITLVSISRDKVYNCPKDCFKIKSCDVKKNFNIDTHDKRLVLTEVIVDIFNPTDNFWEARGRYWNLIDTNAYTLHYAQICYRFKTSRMIPGDELTVLPHTKIRAYLWFPQLDPNSDISSITISHNDKFSSIQVASLNPSVQKMIDEQSNSKPEKDAALIQEVSYDPVQQKFDYLISRLERDCYSRTHNILIQREIIKLENSIRNTRFALDQFLRDLPDEKRLRFHSKISLIWDKYESDLALTKKEEESKASLNAKVEELYNLTDREFEEWTADLFSTLGFDVTLTPQSGDKGIDVICSKDGKLVVVQCKKYKGVVGSPDVQQFLGAIENANADEGYFVTTGTFSIGAEKAAKDTKIILCDKIGLRNLIEVALEK